MAKTKTTSRTKKSATKAKTQASPATRSRKSPKKRTPITAKQSRKTVKSEKLVTIDRRRTAGRRKQETESSTAKSKPQGPAVPRPKAKNPKLERRQKVSRRRQIDPTTCERDYTDHEVVFMNALDEYKRKNGRMFPTCSEVLEVIRSLGYVQLSPAELAARQTTEANDTPEDQPLKPPTEELFSSEDYPEQEAETLIAELAV